MAWTVNLPTDCRLNGAAPATGSAVPTNTNPPPTLNTAEAATFTAKSIISLLGSSLGMAEGLDY